MDFWVKGQLPRLYPVAKNPVKKVIDLTEVKGQFCWYKMMYPHANYQKPMSRG